MKNTDSNQINRIYGKSGQTNAQLAVAILTEYEKAFVPGQIQTTGERLEAMLRTITLLNLRSVPPTGHASN